MFIHRSTRRSVVLSALAFSALPAHAQRSYVPTEAENDPSPDTAENRALIRQSEEALNRIRTLHAKFSQVYAGSSRAVRGQLWVERPGRMRFAYSPPYTRVMVANHGLLLIETPSQGERMTVPLSMVPLGLLLKDDLRLSGEVTVTSIVRAAGLVSISLQMTDAPEKGSATLGLGAINLEPRSYYETDRQGNHTTVTLSNLRMNIPVDPQLFDVTDRRALENNPMGG